MNKPKGYIFGGDTGETYESLQRKRKIADQLASRNSSVPKNIGEGLTAFGNALASRKLGREADAGLNTGRDDYQSKIADLLGGGGQAGTPFNPTQGSPEGDMGAYRGAIASIESAGSGDYSALGPETSKGRAYGRYQVMDFNIPTWTQEVLGRSLTPEQFLASPEAQDAVFDSKFGKSVEKYGNPQDAASVWFTGRPQSQGGDSKDILGTSGNQYVDKFNSAMGGGNNKAISQILQGRERTSNVNPAIIEALLSPYARPQEKAVLQSIMQQQMQANDPLRQLQIEQAQKDLNAPKKRNIIKGGDGFNYYRDTGERVLPGVEAKPTVSQSDYNFYVAQELAAGRVPKSIDERELQYRKAGATNITNSNGEQANIGSIPTGYSVIPDATEPSGFRMVPIAGGPEDTTAIDENRDGNRETSTDIITNAAVRARTAAQERTLDGVAGSIAAYNPSNNNAEVYRQVEVLQSNAKIENLQAMRAASKTGGALGAVSDKESEMLQTKSGALDPASPNFQRDLDDYERTLLRVVHGPRDGDKIFEETRPTTDDASNPKKRLKFNPETGELE